MTFGIVVISISISLARGQGYGSTPATTSYDAFTGGFAILAFLLGMASLGVEVLAPFSLIVDGLTAVTSLAGGIATAIGLRGTDCGNIATIYYNSLVNGGLYDFKGEKLAAIPNEKIQSRCRADKANTAFMFLGFVISLVILAFSFQLHRRTK